jgi:basic membrane lipoprotein Med (substrate-binding protein (PBP1-ABC) superfamily)
MSCVAMLAVAGVASAAADTTEPTNDATEGTSGSATVTAPADLAPVALIIAQGGLGDAAYNDLAFSGLEQGAEGLGLEAQPTSWPRASRSSGAPATPASG